MKGASFIAAILVLSCVWLASAYGKNDKKTSFAVRAQDTTDTWNTIYEDPASGACADASLARDVILWHIDVEDATFQRYEVNGLEVGSRDIVWENEMAFDYIIDCAAAAQDFRMFQFDGSTCKMTSESYVYDTKAYCYGLETDANEVVYINTAASPPNCPANTEEVATSNGSPICLGVHESSYEVGMEEASAMCLAKYNGELYMEMPYFEFTDLLTYLIEEGYDGNYLVQTSWDCDQGLSWGGYSVAAADPINPIYIDQTTLEGKYKVERLYLYGGFQYKLKARSGSENFRAEGSYGFICMTIA